MSKPARHSARARTLLAAAALYCAAASAPLRAEEPGKPPVVPATREPIVVDAVLDEPAWANALEIELPWEWFPADNDPAPVETTALMTFDAENLYIAFRARDSDPGAIRAHYADRDVPFSDDTVGLMIDTFSDQRRAFQFRVNPLGVQMDAINSDVERSEDFSWDAIWESAGRITEDGYVVEIAIPFRQLRFPRSEQPQTWGLLLMRDYPRSVRHRMRSILTDKDRDCFICQFQPVEGFVGMETGASLEVVPTLTGRFSEGREGEVSGPFRTEEEELEPGITANWGITPNVALSGTVNPDFSQVEADAAQLDVNTRFALFFPEKRPFFLEGADLFETPLDLVFTRTVADPVVGLKLTGKEGGNAFGIFAARDRINNLLLPGAQGSRLTSVDEEVTSGVLRWRRDLGEASALGLLYTGRVGEGDYENHVAGIDGLYRFRESDSIRFQLVGSSTRYPDSVVSSFGEPAGRFEGHGLFTTYTHSDADWYWYGSYGELSPEFRADYGFEPRVGIRQTELAVNRRFRGGEETWYSNLYLFLGLDGTREYDGVWNEWGSDLEFTYTGPLQSYFEINLSPNQEHFQGTTYHNLRQEIEAGFQPTGSFELDLEVGWGETIDFANNRQADFVEVAANVGFFLGRRFEGVFELDRQTLDVDGGELFTADIAQTRLIYHLNLRTYVRAILQYVAVERNTALYTIPVEPEEDALLTQLLFSYKVNARTVILAGYSDNHLGTADVSLTQTDRTVFLKLGYAWLR